MILGTIDPARASSGERLKNTPQTDRAADWDTEASVGYGVGDGMPTWWELAHGLDPNARDDAGDFDNDGYTNLEEYLNEIAAWPAPAAIVFNGATNNRYAQITNWDANVDATRVQNWQPSKFDVAHLRAGTTIVDAVGQHAGTLVVAPVAGDNATLNVTAGWVDVATALNVGAAGTGVVNRSGGAGGRTDNHPRRQRRGVGDAAASPARATTPRRHARQGFRGRHFQLHRRHAQADTVAFDLVNNGGVISPGLSPGTTHVIGNLTVNSGSLLLELAGAGTGQYDEIVVDGALTAGGTLRVSLIDGYVPAVGATFDLLDFATASGAFTLDLPALGSGLVWNSAKLLTTGELSVALAPNADFNGDLIVDGQDFVIWQIGLGLVGQTDRTNGDADGNGVVDSADLQVWTSQTGNFTADAGRGNERPRTNIPRALGDACRIPFRLDPQNALLTSADEMGSSSFLLSRV